MVVGGEGEVREMVGVGPGVGEASWFFFRNSLGEVSAAGGCLYV